MLLMVEMEPVLSKHSLETQAGIVQLSFVVFCWIPQNVEKTLHQMNHHHLVGCKKCWKSSCKVLKSEIFAVKKGTGMWVTCRLPCSTFKISQCFYPFFDGFLHVFK